MNFIKKIVRTLVYWLANLIVLIVVIVVAVIKSKLVEDVFED